ncbi:glycosyltransferase family 2 protein [Thiovibrio sp. JS02]
MRISCVIPTRNRAQLVCRAIASVCGQDTPVSELIVVDDGSTDNTGAIVARRFPDCRLLRLPGLGPGPARNAGVAAASGEIVMFLDSDDVWLPGHAGALLAALARGYPVAYGVSRTIDEVSGGEFLIPEAGKGHEGRCLEALARWCFLLPSALALRREAFVACGGFAASVLGEDWAFFIRLANRFPFGFCGPAPITIRYLHAGSLCSQASGGRLDRALAAVQASLAATSVSEEGLASFKALAAWTRRQETDWRTVQEWYSSLRQEDLV